MSHEKKGTYWCCAADFGDHEETCANYKPVTAREDQPRPVIQATSDSQPRHLEEWEKPNWNRAPEAQGATCPNCKSDDPLMCKVPIKEFHRHMGEKIPRCRNERGTENLPEVLGHRNHKDFDILVKNGSGRAYLLRRRDGIHFPDDCWSTPPVNALPFRRQLK